MRCPLIVLALLMGCGPDAPANGVASAAPPGEAVASPSAPPDEPATPGPPTLVRLRVTAEDAPTEGAISLAGVRPGQLAGDWIEAGSRPAFWWSQPSGPLTASMEISAPLAAGLHYFAVLSVDGNDLPDRGDFVGGPVPHTTAGEPLVLAVDRRFGFKLAARPAEAAATPPPAVPTTQSVVLTLDGVEPPAGRVAVLVLGHVAPKDRPDAEEAPPSYIFRSGPLALTFPATLELPLPTGLEVRLVLDVDGDGRPSAADLASSPHPAFAPPSGGGPAAFTIVGPFAEPSTSFQDPPSKDDEWPTDTKPGEGHPIRVSTSVAMKFVKSGRIVVSGYAPTDDAPAGPPAFHWASQTLRLDWPLELDAPLPAGLDIVVALDLNGSGTADGGDLATVPLRKWTPPGGRSDLTLSEVLPTAAP